MSKVLMYGYTTCQKKSERKRKMTEIQTNDLLKIFGAAQATDAVRRYINRDLLLLQQHGDETQQELIDSMENNPDSYVWAMQLDDSAWYQRHPTDREIIGYADKERKQPIYAECGPNKDPNGEYTVRCKGGTFNIKSGDYIYVTAENWNNVRNFLVMSKEQFTKAYTQQG